MKWAGYAEVPIKRLTLPGDIPARQQMPRVMDLARSIELLGDEPINALVVDRATMTLIAGRDRVAALLRLKAKKAWCHMASDVSDQDRLDLEIDENLHRRADDRDKLIASRVAKVAADLIPDKMSAINAGKTGAKKTAKGVAREQVARELDTTPEAVRAAEKRARDEEDAQIAVAQEIAPPVETWGVSVEHLAQEFASVRIAQEAMRAADRHLQSAQRVLGGIEDGGGVAAQLGVLVYNSVHQAAALLRSRIPTALCPYCKGMLTKREKCGGCSAIGYVSDDALLGVADELKLSGKLACVPDGKGGFKRLASAGPYGGVTGQSSVTPKKLQIQDAEGNPLKLPTPDEDFPF